jgi:hypothetical protein
MSTIVTRAGKGSPLTHTEVDTNFTNLNTDKAEDSTVVKLSGDQTISGTKTFSSTISGSINGNAATATNGVVTTGSYANPSWITSLDDGKVLPSMSGNSGKYLTTNGTDSSWGTVAVSAAAVSDQANTSTGYFDLPAGTTAQRPASPSSGATRFNSTLNFVEYYNGTSWNQLQPAPYLVDILIVAGGGGGGGSSGDGVAGGGGAGAGGYLYYTNQLLTVSTALTITVGAGGSRGSQGNVGGQGGSSSVTGYTTAVGGGAGRDADDNNVSISNGGSGGGASGSSGGVAGSGTSGQGNGGGTKNDSNAGSFAGGGGGGIGSAGSGRTRGTGASNSISGSSVTYAEGGYGQGTSNFINAGVDGTANRGFGGNGAFNGSASGGAGGSGVVIISYAGSQKGTGGTVTSVGGNTIHTFTTSGTYTA